ncbi:MAG: DNA cytosine methyltransferase [Lentisphaerae bacterium]|nr:DNA cytosine methyltransferase [Lentisphaerota bacterium]
MKKKAMTKTLRSISLFSGAGGMDIGVRQAGFEIEACVEMDRYACETLRANIAADGSRTRVFEADIRTVDPENLATQININPGELELLFGGPPCQSFSLAGKQLALADDRGPLLFEIIRFAQYFAPRVILLEQVKGLLSAKDANGRKGGVFEEFVDRLEEIGYVPKWRVVLAADYGVSQMRERLFVVATRGRNGFEFPAPSHASPEEVNGLFPLPPYKTVGEAISGLGTPDRKIKGTTFHDRLDSHVDVTPDRDRERIAQVPEGSYLAAQTMLGDDLICGLSPKDTTKYLRMHRKRPANTLRCGEIFFHPVEDRYLTPREYMRIHGYPDDYRLKGPIRSRTGSVKNLDQHRQVSNSVPPPLACAMATQIKDYINE